MSNSSQQGYRCLNFIERFYWTSNQNERFYWTSNQNAFTKGILCRVIFIMSFTYISLLYSAGERYRKTSNISRILVGNEIFDNSDVVGASPIGAAPTTSLFIT